MNKKEKIYTEAGGHTFFVPVEEGFKVKNLVRKEFLKKYESLIIMLTLISFHNFVINDIKNCL